MSTATVPSALTQEAESFLPAKKEGYTADELRLKEIENERRYSKDLETRGLKRGDVESLRLFRTARLIEEWRKVDPPKYHTKEEVAAYHRHHKRTAIIMGIVLGSIWVLAMVLKVAARG